MHPALFEKSIPLEEDPPMKRALVATVLAAAVAFTAGTVAWAADMEGTVKIIKINERVMTLSDGTQLYWTDKVQVQDIKEGTKIKATYEPQDGKLVLTKLEVVK
jgi:Cu/Ag efflux protein CusF